MMVMLLIKLLIFLHLLLTTEARGINVALGKNVTMSSEFTGGVLKGEYAVDGKLPDSYSESGTCYCCAATQTQTDPWLKVDLGTMFWVFYVVVTGREGTTETFDNMEIYLHKVESLKGQSQRNFTKSPTWFNVSFIPYKEARYLTLIQRGNLLTVYCEVEVYGECPDGRFGGKCDECHCAGEICEKEHGVCPSGVCVPGYEESSCSRECRAGTYGQDCGEDCGHCRNNQACDNVDGTCISCQYGFLGDRCKIESNQARGKTVTLSSQRNSFNFLASHAVDGKVPSSTSGPPNECACCAATSDVNPWIRIDLNATFNILVLTVYGGNSMTYEDTEVYLHNETEKGDNVKLISNRVTFVNVSFSPPVAARYVTLQQKGKNREGLYCEIMVIAECPDGRFGKFCDRCYCEGEKCDKWRGSCPSGRCLPGYNGSSCQRECPGRTYGQNCSEVCGECLGQERCNIVDGVCSLCAAGYKGKTCKELCDTRTFGYNCSGVCHCESNKSCDPVSGECPDDLCASGWHGHTCSEKCPAGLYGEGCNNQCGHCMTTDDCDHVVGNCTECGPGYIGQFCITECEFGKYGLNCSDTCHCLNNSLCSHVDGSCLDNRCAFGWMGPNCSLYSNVAFGKTVELSTSVTYAGWNAEKAVDDVIPDELNAHVCDCCTSTSIEYDPWLRVDFGTVYMIFTVIIHGRKDSDESLKKTNIFLQTQKNDFHQTIDTILNDVTVFNKTFNHPVPAQYITLVQRGHKALIVCEVEAYSGYCRHGTYGYLCDHMCHCDRPSCNTKTGECFSGNCLPGYQGNKCDQVCPEGTFGHNCSSSCGNCIARAPCDHVTGSCQACASSFTGKLCKEEISRENNFLKILIFAGSGVGGLVVLIVAIVTAVCICRKCRANSRTRRTSYSPSEPHVYNSMDMSTFHHGGRSSYEVPVSTDVKSKSHAPRESIISKLRNSYINLFEES